MAEKAQEVEGSIRLESLTYPSTRGTCLLLLIDRVDTLQRKYLSPGNRGSGVGAFSPTALFDPTLFVCATENIGTQGLVESSALQTNRWAHGTYS